MEQVAEAKDGPYYYDYYDQSESGRHPDRYPMARLAGSHVKYTPVMTR